MSLVGPTTKVVDDFNTGASQNLSARAGWASGEYWLGEPTMTTDATPTGAIVTADNAYRSNYRAGVFADSEVWIKLGGLGSGANQTFVISIRGSGTGTANVSDYELKLRVNAGTWTFSRNDAGAAGPTLASGSLTYAVGDSFLLRSVGSDQAAWLRPSGSTTWQLLGEATDATYASGVIALQMRFATTTGITDEFGGGPVVRGLAGVGAGA